MDESVVLSAASGLLWAHAQLHTLRPDTFQLSTVFLDRTHVTTDIGLETYTLVGDGNHSCRLIPYLYSSDWDSGMLRTYVHTQWCVHRLAWCIPLCLNVEECVSAAPTEAVDSHWRHRHLRGVMCNHVKALPGNGRSLQESEFQFAVFQLLWCYHLRVAFLP